MARRRTHFQVFALLAGQVVVLCVQRQVSASWQGGCRRNTRAEPLALRTKLRSSLSSTSMPWISVSKRRRKYDSTSCSVSFWYHARSVVVTPRRVRGLLSQQGATQACNKTHLGCEQEVRREPDARFERRPVLWCNAVVMRAQVCVRRGGDTRWSENTGAAKTRCDSLLKGAVFSPAPGT